MTLDEAQERIDELQKFLVERDREIGALKSGKLIRATYASGYDFCQRCYGPSNGRKYCSRDCEFFRAQEPFETLYKRLHPQWPAVRGTEVAQPWRPKAQSVHA